jgi:hypothetical protein
MLRTFSLHQVLIPWSLIPRGQLTHLKIVFSSAVFSAIFPPHGDLNQLIDLLINCPGLEVLILVACLPSQLTEFIHDQTIHLPRLSRLRLDGPSSRMTNLLRMLKIPSSTTLQLYCASEISFSHNLMLPLISAHFQSLVPVNFKTLSVTVCYARRLLKVIASTSTSRIPQSEDDMFVLLFEGVPELGESTDFIKRACKLLPISNLEFLSIHAPGIVHSVNWVEVFEQCTEVTTMEAIGRGTSSLVRAITTRNTKAKPGRKKRRDNRNSTSAQPARSTASHAHVPIFPKLAFMLLTRLDFAQRKRSLGILFDVVQKGLRERMVAYRGYRALKMLRIENCIVSAKRAKALQSLVQTFHWDGKESFPEESEEDVYHSRPGWELFSNGTT